MSNREMNREMGIDRSDLIAGIYAFCVLNHGGMGSRLYRTLSLIIRTCRPSEIPAGRIADGHHEWSGAHEVYTQMQENYS